MPRHGVSAGRRVGERGTGAVSSNQQPPWPRPAVPPSIPAEQRRTQKPREEGRALWHRGRIKKGFRGPAATSVFISAGRPGLCPRRRVWRTCPHPAAREKSAISGCGSGQDSVPGVAPPHAEPAASADAGLARRRRFEGRQAGRRGSHLRPPALRGFPLRQFLRLNKLRSDWEWEPRQARARHPAQPLAGTAVLAREASHEVGDCSAPLRSGGPASPKPPACGGTECGSPVPGFVLLSTRSRKPAIPRTLGLKSLWGRGSSSFLSWSFFSSVASLASS